MIAVEIHITVSVTPEAQASFETFVAANKLKKTFIELSSGLHPRQLMVTTHLRDFNVVAAAHRLAGRLAEVSGIEVSRLKIEADADERRTPCLYIEHHVKVALPCDDRSRLETIAADSGGVCSRNAFRVFAGATEERFVTQRFPPELAEVAEASLESLLQSLRASQFDVLKVERERVVYDDNVELDKGWLN